MTTAEYLADLRDHRFLLFEQFKLQELLEHPRFQHIDSSTASMMLDQAYAFVRREIAPLNATGDAQGCRLEHGSVRTPEGFREAWHRYYEFGWRLVAVNPEYGGQGAPALLAMPIDEMVTGANMAFSMYPALTWGAAEVIETFGSAAQKACFLRNMFQGVWSGTMCLTEAHAGSDLSMLKTKAVPEADGTYSISGTKTFISGGDHDLTENIVHMVLARVVGGPPGTKGLSLFIVPKQRVSSDGQRLVSNDVHVVGVEHKMGIAGSSTCTLSFGDEGKCVGELIGGPESLHVGMRQIFQLMNNARLGVGLQGQAIAAAAYLRALRYARDRRQGSSITQLKDPVAPRVPIVDHADVRRMLLDMKVRVEGLRALHAKISNHFDRAAICRLQDPPLARRHIGQVELLTPIFKSYATDQGFRVCELAIQTFGGSGYTRDSGVEQNCRDVKVCSLYEGTNHIQAMDLVGRKLMLDGGVHFQHLLQDISTFIAAQRHRPLLADASVLLEATVSAVQRGAGILAEWASVGQLDKVAANANRFLEAMAECTLGWLLLEQAAIAEDKLAQLDEAAPDRDFYLGKRYGARHFAESVLRATPVKIDQLSIGDSSALEIPEGAFAQS